MAAPGPASWEVGMAKSEKLAAERAAGYAKKPGVTPNAAGVAAA
jgi:hypothetical protein